MPTLIAHLVAHKQYSAFEEYYLQLTKEFYTIESAGLADTMEGEPRRFFKHIHTRIQEEEQRSKNVLLVGSWGLVREVAERALWEGRVEWVTSSCGCFLLFSSATLRICACVIPVLMVAADSGWTVYEREGCLFVGCDVYVACSSWWNQVSMRCIQRSCFGERM